MKKLNYLVIVLFLFSTIITQSCYVRLGDINMVSNRNIDTNTEYILLERYVRAKGKSKNGNALEKVLDKVVKKVSGGEYLKNAKIDVKNNGKRIRIEGDVWGIEGVLSDKDIKEEKRELNKSEREQKIKNISSGFSVNDTVSWRNTITNIEREGVIVVIGEKKAVISTVNSANNPVRIKIGYNKLFKTN